MDKFYALAAPIRRQIIALLSDGDQLTATTIAESFHVSPSAISQHLKVLLDTNLVSMHKQAQQRIYELNPLAVLELENWAKQMVQHFEKLGEFVEGAEADDAQARSK